MKNRKKENKKIDLKTKQQRELDMVRAIENIKHGVYASF